MPFYLARSYGKVLTLLNNSVHLSHGLVELVGAAGEDREGVGRGVEGAGRGEEFAGFEVFYGGECLAETVFGEGAAALVGEIQAAADEDGGEEAAEHVLPVEAPAGFEGKFLDAGAVVGIAQINALVQLSSLWSNGMSLIPPLWSEWTGIAGRWALLPCIMTPEGQGPVSAPTSGKYGGKVDCLNTQWLVSTSAPLSRGPIVSLCEARPTGSILPGAVPNWLGR